MSLPSLSSSLLPQPTTAWEWIQLLGLAYVFIFTSQVFYDYFLNPLAKFPGPRLLAISRLPLTRRLIDGSQTRWVAKLHEKYGPIVRLAPDQLSFTDERAWRDVAGSTQYAKYGMEKDERLNRLVGGETLNPDPSMSKEEQKHTLMRRAFAPALTKSALRQQEDIIQGHADEMVSVLNEKGVATGNAIDLVKTFNYLAYNIFSDLFLGRSLNLFRDQKYQPWVDSTRGFAVSTISMGALQHFVVARYILAIIIRRFGKGPRDRFMQPCIDLFNERLERDVERPDLVYLATKEKKTTQAQLPVKDMRDFSPFLMIAGGETTPTSLSGFFYAMLTHKDKMARLTQEIRGAFKTREDITMANLYKLEYLSACIEENLRMYPPLPAGVERVVPPGGAPVAGHHLPAKTVVLVPGLSMFQHPSNFERSHEFIPERWLPEGKEEFSRDRHGALKPFSVGPHACFGQDLAHFVIRLAVTRLIFEYDISLHSDSEKWLDDQPIWFIWIKPALKVVLRPAGSAAPATNGHAVTA